MRVLIAGREYPPFEVGGVAKHTFHLVSHLRKLGAKCKVLSFGDPRLSNDETEFLKPSSSIISRNNSSSGMDSKIPQDIIRFGEYANSMIQSEDYDIVHVEEPYVGAFIKHKKKVTTVHDTSYGEIKAILHRPGGIADIKRAIFYTSMGPYLELKCMSSSRSVIAPAIHVKKELVRVYGRAPSDITVIGNGVELPQTFDKASARQEIGLSNGKLLVLTASQHVARKRLDTLIESVKLLKQRQANGFRVTMLGDGPLRPFYEGLVNKYELSDLFDFPGWVSEEKLHRYFEAADIYALTSEYEAGPISLLEAMSYGDAVASSRIDGFPSLMRDGLDGLLFTTSRADELASCLNRLISDSKLRNELAESGKNFAQRFGWQKIARETMKLYERVLAG